MLKRKALISSATVILGQESTMQPKMIGRDEIYAGACQGPRTCLPRGRPIERPIDSLCGRARLWRRSLDSPLTSPAAAGLKDGSDLRAFRARDDSAWESGCSVPLPLPLPSFARHVQRFPLQRQFLTARHGRCWPPRRCAYTSGRPLHR
jgi:hypothetical protein